MNLYRFLSKTKRQDITTTCVVVVMSLLCMVSCGGDTKDIVVVSFDPETSYTLKTTDLTTLISDSGITRYRVKAEEVLMFDKAKEFGCNKIALGHHGDDAIETLLLNMVHGSKIATFQPKQYMSRMNMFMIRPMIYLKEQEIIDICKNNQIPAVRRVCPNDGVTQRQKMKDILHQFYRQFPQAQDNFLNALSNQEQLSLWKKEDSEFKDMTI